MKKITIILMLVCVIAVSSLNAIFERTRNFFRGNYPAYYYPYGRYSYNNGRYYYYDSNAPGYRYVYYDAPIKPAGVDEKTTVNEDDSKYVITIILPGYNKSDIHITAQDRAIQVVANASTLTEGVDVSVAPKVPSIEQVIPLGTVIDPTGVTSAYVQGVLTITVPKYTQIMKKAIPVPIE